MWLRLNRRDLRRLILAVGLVLSCTSGSSADGTGAAPVSTIQVPLDLDLGPLFQAAETSLPTQTGHWPGWRDWHGFDTRYRAWRGPLLLTMQGEVLQAQAHVRYQLEVRKDLIGGLGLSTGCGVDEPPRQALIGLLARLDWGPDWSLWPRFQVLPTRFLDRCEVTVAEIDVSPLVGRVFEERIESSLKEAMGTLVPRLHRMRGEAARLWQALQTPRELMPGLWLRVEPLGLALAPPQGTGSRVQIAVWLALRATLSADAGTPRAPIPLPPLVPYRPAQPGLNLALRLQFDYPQVSAVLRERLAGQTLTLEGRRVSLSGLELGAKGEDLVLEAKLTGDVAGRLSLMARPAFDPIAQTLRLEQLDYVFDAADSDQGLIAGLFYDRIRARIESEANALLAERTRGLREALGTTLSKELPPELAPDLSALRVSDLEIAVRGTGLELTGTVAGPLRLGAPARP